MVYLFYLFMCEKSILKVKPADAKKANKITQHATSLKGEHLSNFARPHFIYETMLFFYCLGRGRIGFCSEIYQNICQNAFFSDKTTRCTIECIHHLTMIMIWWYLKPVADPEGVQGVRSNPPPRLPHF